LTLILSDISIIESVLSGKTSDFEVLYHRYKHYFMLICIRYSDNRKTAEDNLQDGYVLVYKRLKQFDKTKGTFKSWATRVMINVCLMEVRKNKVHLLDINDGGIENKINFENEKANSNLRLQELTRLIQNLPRGQRTVFNLYAIDGFTHREIASKLEISESTSKTQFMKAKKVLKEQILNEQKISNKFYG